MNNENPKIPCGGFRIGDGLTMDGDTLKSLGGAFVKVNTQYLSGKIYVTVANDSPVKTYAEIIECLNSGVPVTVIAKEGNSTIVHNYSCYSGDDKIFQRSYINLDNIYVDSLTVTPSDKWSYGQKAYSLTSKT